MRSYRSMYYAIYAQIHPYTWRCRVLFMQTIRMCEWREERKKEQQYSYIKSIAYNKIQKTITMSRLRVVRYSESFHMIKKYKISIDKLFFINRQLFIWWERRTRQYFGSNYYFFFSFFHLLTSNAQTLP